MKNYIISEEQLEKIIEQIDDDQNNTDKEKDEFSRFFSKKKVSDEPTKDEVTLPDDDPFQQFFDSLV